MHWSERIRTSPATAAALSAIVPGLGQFVVGRRRRGLLLAGVALVLTAVSIAFVVTNRSEVALWWFRPTALRWMLVGNGVVFALRVAAAVDAWIVTSGSDRPVAGATLVLIAVAALVAPHWFFAERDLAAAELLTIFPTTTSTTTTTTTTTSSPSSTLADGSTTSTSTTTTTTTRPPPPPRLWDGVGRLNIALLGGDAGIGRRGVRTDTLMVISIDPDSGNVGLFQVQIGRAHV